MCDDVGAIRVKADVRESLGRKGLTSLTSMSSPVSRVVGGSQYGEYATRTLSTWKAVR